MNVYGIQVAEKVRKDLAKRAVTLAMHSRWAEAVTMNEAILADFPATSRRTTAWAKP